MGDERVGDGGRGWEGSTRRWWWRWCEGRGSLGTADGKGLRRREEGLDGKDRGSTKRRRRVDEG
jgi:hypothetical protein